MWQFDHLYILSGHATLIRGIVVFIDHSGLYFLNTLIIIITKTMTMNMTMTMTVTTTVTVMMVMMMMLTIMTVAMITEYLYSKVT